MSKSPVLAYDARPGLRGGLRITGSRANDVPPRERGEMPLNGLGQSASGSSRRDGSLFKTTAGMESSRAAIQMDEADPSDDSEVALKAIKILLGKVGDLDEVRRLLDEASKGAWAAELAERYGADARRRRRANDAAFGAPRPLSAAAASDALDPEQFYRRPATTERAAGSFEQQFNRWRAA